MLPGCSGLSRVAAVTLCTVLLVPATPSPANAVDDRDAKQIRQRLEYLINRTRARHGLRRLRVGSYIQQGATDHARKMRRKRRIFHDPYLAHEVPKSATAWAENVGYTGADKAAKRLHRMFMNSSGHRSNILRKRWNRMGIGVAKSKRYVFVAERFVDRN